MEDASTSERLLNVWPGDWRGVASMLGEYVRLKV